MARTSATVARPSVTVSVTGTVGYFSRYGRSTAVKVRSSPAGARARGCGAKAGPSAASDTRGAEGAGAGRNGGRGGTSALGPGADGPSHRDRLPLGRG